MKQPKVKPIPQWISVKDRYPEVGQHVIYFFDVCGTYVGKYLGDHCFAGECGFLTDDVTHWMPYKTATRRAPSLAHELLAQCEAYHTALDMMFAHMIERTANDQPHCFFPSESGPPWEICGKGLALIERARHELKGGEKGPCP